MAGWPVVKQARALHESGRIIEATYEAPVLRGKYSEGGKQFPAGLRMRNPIDVENLCPCRESRVRGIICAHSVAVGLEVLHPRKAAKPEPARVERPASAPTGEVPTVKVKLEGSLRHLEAEISFSYSQPGVCNPAAEAQVLTEMLGAGFQEYKGKAALQGEEQVVQFFANTLPQWKDRWQVEEGERFQHVTKDIVRIEPHFAMKERGDGWLDFHVHYTAGKNAVFSPTDLRNLLQTSKGSVKLGDGRIAVADAGLEAEIEQVLRDCDPKQERGGYRLSPVHRAYMEASVAEWTGRATPQTSQGLPESELGSLRNTLRPYQREGALWLLQRARSGLGGLLADEMGLGKTVQTLAMLESLRSPALVVCPSSLVWNWKREAAHFLPGLKVLALDGPQRAQLFPKIPQHDLAITSYALLRRDIEMFRDYEFGAVILDEAQHIKNPESQNAKSAYALRSKSRFILTGTPIENSLRDLWSLYEFLLPGYLGKRQDFKDTYETPLLNGAVGSSWERLNRRLRPYLLRRRKQEILTELPDKIEQVIEVELSDQQKTAYTQLQQTARSQIDAMKDAGSSAGATRMRVLTALLRLRQACCDLRLLGAPEGTESGKLNALRELLSEAIDGGHRVLVFSQFTSMLDLIGENLNEAGISFCRLDGSTKDREGVVQRFQTDASIPVFLISLKAGGVGLNLTAADTVIHFDPWWNPAVEAQATDRAHRIGQKNVVTSIKLIARDTVEERVLRMQQKKRELLEGTVDADTALERLDTEDLRELVG
ncbi:hypothetical protein DB345_14760 [Spartobacteria bacterium LR76]|nr:hypothetical protein DB345_14760 [Spartobacteria bacterium LR76]